MWSNVYEFLQAEYAGITVQRMGLALVAILVGLIGAALVKGAIRRLQGVAQKTQIKYDDVLFDALLSP